MDCLDFGYKSCQTLSNKIIPGRPRDFALRLDHVVKTVFQSANYNDLLKCRFQSRRWNSFATSELKKRHFSLTFVNHKTERGSSLEDLVNLLQVREVGSSLHLFPCFKFRIKWSFQKGSPSGVVYPFMEDTVLQTFLSNPMVHIQELFLEIKERVCTNESLMMEKIYQVLANQASNLQYLSLAVPFEFQTPWNVDETSFPDSALRATDPEFHWISSTFNSPSCTMFAKLETIFLPIKAPKVLEMLIRLAPNLKEVVSLKDDCFYLVEPVNRLHLLKRIFILPFSLPHMIGYENLARACKNGNLKLREIKHFLPDSDSIWFDEDFTRNHWIHRASKIVNTLLACSFDSLESFEMFPSINILPGILWPKIMPRLHTLTISGHYDYNGQNIFPLGFNFAQRFPTLRSIYFAYVESVSKFEEMMCSLNIDAVCSVTQFCVELESKEFELLLPQHILQITKMFPRSSIWLKK